MYEIEFLKQQGDKTWLQGLEYIPAKLRALSEINKVLAHQPWLLSPGHIEVSYQLIAESKTAGNQLKLVHFLFFYTILLLLVYNPKDYINI